MLLQFIMVFSVVPHLVSLEFFFFFKDPAAPEFSPLPPPGPLPISPCPRRQIEPPGAPAEGDAGVRPRAVHASPAPDRRRDEGVDLRRAGDIGALGERVPAGHLD